MKSEIYRARRLAGDCIAAMSCADKAERAGYCGPHYREMRKLARAQRAIRYLAAKTAGRCTRGSCKQPACEESLFCRPHRDDQAEKRRTRDGKAPGRSSARANATRRRRVERGLCCTCGRERLARGRSRWYGLRCLEKRTRRARAALEAAIQAGQLQHRKRCSNCLRNGCRLDLCPRPRDPRADEVLAGQARDAQRARRALAAERAGRKLRITYCSLCGEPRCRADKCRNGTAWPALRIEDFATARQEAA